MLFLSIQHTDIGVGGVMQMLTPKGGKTSGKPKGFRDFLGKVRAQLFEGKTRSFFHCAGQFLLDREKSTVAGSSGWSVFRFSDLILCHIAAFHFCVWSLRARR